MGKYINPPNMTIEQFLEAYGQPLTPVEFIKTSYSEQTVMQRMIVAHVDNGNFTAALILDDDFEYLRVKRSMGDGRPTKYYSVPKNRLEPYLL